MRTAEATPMSLCSLSLNSAVAAWASPDRPLNLLFHKMYTDAYRWSQLVPAVGFGAQLVPALDYWAKLVLEGEFKPLEAALQQDIHRRLPLTALVCMCASHRVAAGHGGHVKR